MGLNRSDHVLYEKYYKSLCYFAWQMVHNEILAEDLAHDAFLSYFQHKKKISQHELAIRSFLYSSVKFAVFNLNRKSKTVARFWDRTGFQELDDIDYEHQVIRAEFMLAVQDRLEKLPEGCRRVMILSYIEGLSNDEIAQELKVTINTIKTHKKRGLRVLRKTLSPEDFASILVVLLV
ncbi:RNA polymerase sigma factor [Sphingobacterium psychroaquaticum]|uniref:RNA polymerase sigma-70 factor, ECF subfamily n=1 Tax=Sphingobacterium psychroaquaticum TaxID=561061 RepID=A0A1X7J9S0_9SPHI|nr:sigma-70 family RNA polymerase sigma factor [Sphingobacterium psychroaquaticum]QBQ39963.1 sigma-70 family RNA polymerase sigma factor [Sphingobacterium psychroaquaticum]SMG24559.1 RNA polymerase sigma-70 factor, ECF subfamily [Sphingobacterium psychroaquaticum]